MSNIILANLVLIIGPLFYRVVSGSKKVLELVDGFIFIAIGGLVLEHLVPAVIGQNGLIIFALALVGFIGPNLLEKYLSKHGSSVHKGVLFFGILGFCLHVAIDGAALVSPEQKSLSSAIIIHRLPIGLTVWYLLRPYFGILVAGLAIASMMLTTVFGYFWFESFVHIEQNFYIELIQAAAAGAILHVVVYRFHLDPDQDTDSCCSHHDHSHSSDPEVLTKYKIPVESIGNLIAFCFLLLLSHTHSNFWNSFVAILEESAFALCVGYIIGALIFALFPHISLSWFSKGGNVSQTSKGIIFGLPLPVCSCGVLPIYESLVKRGAPMAAGFAFLLATPELGIDAFLLSFPLLGYKLTMLRLYAVVIFTFIVTIAVVVLSKNIHNEDKYQLKNNEVADGHSFIHNFLTALFQLIENTAAWILLGILFAVLSQNLIDESFLLSIKGYDVIIFSIIGIFLYVCASGSTPLIAVLISSGLSIGAGISFLLTGPATNISTFGVLSNLHSKKVAIIFSSASALTAVLIGYLVNYFFSDIKTPILHHEPHGHEDLSIYLYFLIFLMSATILKIGARRFFSQVFK